MALGCDLVKVGELLIPHLLRCGLLFSHRTLRVGVSLHGSPRSVVLRLFKLQHAVSLFGVRFSLGAGGLGSGFVHQLVGSGKFGVGIKINAANLGERVRIHLPTGLKIALRKDVLDRVGFLRSRRSRLRLHLLLTELLQHVRLFHRRRGIKLRELRVQVLIDGCVNGHRLRSRLDDCRRAGCEVHRGGWQRRSGHGVVGRHKRLSKHTT